MREWLLDPACTATGTRAETLHYKRLANKCLRHDEIVNVERFSAPAKHGGKYYFRKNDGLQNQSVLYRVDKLEGTPSVVIDPNLWSKEGTVALGSLNFSDDGKLLAECLKEAISVTEI